MEEDQYYVYLDDNGNPTSFYDLKNQTYINVEPEYGNIFKTDGTIWKQKPRPTPPQPQPEAQPQPQSEHKPEKTTEPESKSQPQSETKSQPEKTTESESKSQPQSEPKPEKTAESEPEKKKLPKLKNQAPLSGSKSQTTFTLSDTRKFLPGEGEYVPPLPEDYDIRIKVSDYAERNFRPHKTGGIFSKKVIPPTEIVKYTDQAISSPLLIDIPPALEKQAVTLFNNILAYQASQSESQSKQIALGIAKTLLEKPKLIDECFFQLVKQSNCTPDEKQQLKALELLLLVSTIFPASKSAKNYIIAHLMNVSRSPVEEIASISEFIYIRFMARTDSERILKFDDEESVWPSLEEIVNCIATDYKTGNHYFNASIYEMMWFQIKNKAGNNVYPWIMKPICQAILDAGALKVEGVFRLSGSRKKQKDKAQKLYCGTLDLNDMNLYDLSTLFKAWFRCFTCPLIPFDRLDKLPDASKSKKIVEFANDLPLFHKNTLKFLIGFCQTIKTAEPVNNMSSDNLGICISQSLYNIPPSLDDTNDIYLGYARQFVSNLVDNWDVSDVYNL